MYPRTERGQQLREPIVLALRDVQVARVEEAVRWVVERRAERRARPLDEDVEQRRGHALGAKTAYVNGHGPVRIAATQARRSGRACGSRSTMVDTGFAISSFGEGALYELFVVDRNGGAN